MEDNEGADVVVGEVQRAARLKIKSSATPVQSKSCWFFSSFVQRDEILCSAQGRERGKLQERDEG